MMMLIAACLIFFTATALALWVVMATAERHADQFWDALLNQPHAAIPAPQREPVLRMRAQRMPVRVAPRRAPPSLIEIRRAAA